jgi:hypothetical protein
MNRLLAGLGFTACLSLSSVAREIYSGDSEIKIPEIKETEDITTDESPRSRMTRGFIAKGNTLAACFVRRSGDGFFKVTMIGDADKNPLKGDDFGSFLQQIKHQTYDAEEAANFNRELKQWGNKAEKLINEFFNQEIAVKNASKTSVRISAETTEMISMLGIVRATAVIEGKTTPIMNVMSTSVVRIKERAFVVSNTRRFLKMEDLDGVERETLDFLERFSAANPG